MPRVREITEEGDDPVLRDVFGKEREAFGDLLNPTRVMAHCPPIMLAAKRLSAAVEKSNLLPAQMRALVYLRVATLNGCPF
jgi:alkylhydroperoxidase family enzyme